MFSLYLRRLASVTTKTSHPMAFLSVTKYNLGTLTFRSVMGIDANSNDSCKGRAVIGPDGKKLKPCCACPETKRQRDECIIEKGEVNCQHLIEAHKACMRSLGFNI